MTAQIDYGGLSKGAIEQLQREAVFEAKKQLGLHSKQYDAFKRKYFDDPSGFIRECINWGRVPGGTAEAVGYQIEIADMFQGTKRVTVRGPHGLGKTAFAAWLILWFALTRDGLDWKIPCTASAWRQLEKYLFPEIHKWVRFLRWRKIGRQPFRRGKELLSLSLKLATGEAFALASDNHNYLEGAHADHMLYVFDEAKIIPVKTWDAAEGAFSTGNCYWLAISTPGEPNGRFYDIHSRKPGYEDWMVRHVTLSDAILAGRVRNDWAEQRKKQWGEKSAVYLNRVAGEFASSAEEKVITLHLVEAAIDRWHDWNDNLSGGTHVEVDAIGVDVGWGGDKSVIALRWGSIITEIIKIDVKDVMVIANRVDAYLGKYSNAYAMIDAIGIGAGVYNRLQELGRNARGFIAGAKTNYRDKSDLFGFADTRSAAWWQIRELLEDGEMMIPDDDELIGDLTAPGWEVRAGGKIKVEAKKDIKKTLGRSTDCGDAVIQAFWTDSSVVEFSDGDIPRFEEHEIDHRYTEVFVND